MDRGRAGGFITDNNFVMVKFNEKKRKEHLHRLDKIRNRKPGSSITLDNNPPVIIQAALTNPRKVALLQNFNFVTEQENKALLKRISSILVAPPKITDKEYQDMKKLCVSTTKSTGGKNVFEERIIEKKNKEFFENLKKTKAYYNPKSWEDDYKKQLFNQKFMRQVKYKRSPTFVDPLAPKVDTPQPTQPKVRLLKPIGATTKSRSSAHIDRVRAQKSKANHSNSSVPQSISRNSNNSPNNDDDNYGTDGDFLDSDDQNDIEIQVFKGNEEYDHDAFYQDGEIGFSANELRLPLATVSRLLRLWKESGDEEYDDNDFETCVQIDATVECTLVNHQYLVLSVVGNDAGVTLECEAEIKAKDLCMLSDSVYDEQIDPSSIADLAQQMVENVEMKIDKSGVPRLVLNLVNETDDGESKYDSTADWEPVFGATALACATEEELQEMLLPDRSFLVISCGVSLPVTFTVHPGMQGTGNIMQLIDVAQKSARVETIFALLNIYNTPDDQMLIKAIFVTSTKSNFKRGGKLFPAVECGSTATLLTPLPSIIQADPDMIYSFAENLSKNIKVDHDTKTGENILVTDS